MSPATDTNGFLARNPEGTRMLWRAPHHEPLTVEVAGEPFTLSDDLNRHPLVPVRYSDRAGNIHLTKAPLSQLYPAT